MLRLCKNVFQTNSHNDILPLSIWISIIIYKDKIEKKADYLKVIKSE